jgi:murein L,D-transpeptidase YcbB/YkuD
MYRSRYYTGFHDPHVAGGDEQNISDYTSGVSRVLAGIAHALDGWTVGAEPPPAYTEPAAPFDLYSAEGVQKALNALENAGLKEDGIAGPKTAAAVIMFQRAHGLTPDGVVGKATRGALASALAKLTSP